MAVVTMGEENETLRIRQTPDASSLDNVVGQAANGSRYPVLGEQDGWVQIREGYISSEFVTIEMGLSEGEKLDLKTMALNQYDNLLISRVDNYLNIRSEPKVDAYDENVIGKLPVTRQEKFWKPWMAGIRSNPVLSPVMSARIMWQQALRQWSGFAHGTADSDCEYGYAQCPHGAQYGVQHLDADFQGRAVSCTGSAGWLGAD